MAGPFDIFGDDSAASAPAEPLSAEEEAKLAERESRTIKEEDRTRLEALLLGRVKQRKTDLEKMLEEMSGHWGYDAITLAQIRLVKTAPAVERFRLTHGRLTENLNSLTPQFLNVIPSDPFDGAPLRYRRLAKGYVIYSVDSASHDDGGREGPERKKSTDKTSYDITFTVER